MIEHVSLRVADAKKSRRFYEKALAALGYKLTHKYDDAFGFMQGGRTDFWISKGEVGTPNHVAFTAATHEAIDAFYKAAMASGGKDHGKPGPREGYAAWAAFVIDPDGHNIEAACFDELDDGETLETVQKKRIAQARPAKATPKPARAKAKKKR